MTPKRRDQRSPEAREYRQHYGTARWQRIRIAQLQKQPLCERHLKRGEIVVATVCHHVDPTTKATAFFDGPFASSCEHCHNSDEQSEERTGRKRVSIGADGWPID